MVRADGRLPDVAAFERAVRGAGEQFSLRGVEVTAVGALRKDEKGLALLLDHTGELVRLAPLEHRIEWSFRGQRAPPIGAEEKGAWERLQSAAPAPRVRVVGPLAGGTLEVRQVQAPVPAPVRMGTHGMVLFGGGGAPLYASHIPMFHAPHDLQLVLQISMRHPGWRAPATFSDTGHALVPERLDLTALAEGRLTAFKAAVFRGNFEAGGTELVKDVEVKVEQVVLSRALSTATPAAAPLRYLWLPGGFLLHAITAPPDFDHVVRVKGGSKAAAGAPLSLPGRPNEGARRLREREVVKLDAASLTVERELSFLVGPDFVVPEN
ncbi:MAG TPA: hypothetical protein VFB81_21620 [Myxococcales bacterium]|nr:hypothetical protein [Myxococcales bacterium]